LSQKAKDFNKLVERNGSLYVKNVKTFKPTLDINEYVEKSAGWAFAQKYFKNTGEERTSRQIICDAIQGKLGEFAVYKILKEKGYELKEPDYTSIRDKGEYDDGDLSIGDINIQVKTHNSKNNLFKLKKEEFDVNGVYHNWGKKKPILYTYFFMCRINTGVRKALESLEDSEFNLENVLKFTPHLNFKMEVTGFININDFRKIISENQFIPAKTKINNAYSFNEEFYYSQTGDLREIEEISKKK
jgi:hypothetical protein